MAFLDWLKIIFLGIVEGITEWLPISSTGHLILVDALWKTENHPVLTEAFMTNLFDVVIQLGAIIAVLVLFWHKLWPFHTKTRRRQRSCFREASDNRFVCGVQRFCDNYCYMDKIVMWLKIAVSCVPAAIAGFLLDDWMSAHLYNPYVVAAMLILYGVGFIVVEKRNEGRTPRIQKMSEFRWSDALLIGLFQVLSLVPGTSRSGATIVGALMIGVSRTVAAEFTFFLAIPVMFGASLLKLVKFGLAFTSTELAILLIGMVTAFVSSLIIIRFLLGYIKKHDFKVFGYYRIILGVLVLAYFFFS